MTQDQAIDIRERAHNIAFGFPAELSPDERADLTAEIYALLAAIRAEAESAPVKRLYDALSAMMYGWEDDSTRIEAFAALKAAEPFIASVKPQREGQ